MWTGVALALAATLGYATLAWRGRGRTPVSASICAASIAAAGILLHTSVFVLGLAAMLLPAWVLAFSVMRRRASAWAFAAMAVSDVALCAAFTLMHTQSLDHHAPAPGSWSAGASLLAVSAVVRLGAGALARGRGAVRGLDTIAMWQGMFIALLAGEPGAPVLFAGGVLLWLAAGSGAGRRESAVLALAGGTACFAAGLGGGAAISAAVGLGALAVLVSDASGLLNLLAMPLSAPAAALVASTPQSFDRWHIAVAMAVPIAWLSSARLTIGSNGLTFAGVAGLIVGVVGMSGRLDLVAGSVVLAVASALIVPGSPERIHDLPAIRPPQAIPEHGGPARVPGVIALGLAAALFVRIGLLGLKTGFL